MTSPGFKAASRARSSNSTVAGRRAEEESIRSGARLQVGGELTAESANELRAEKAELQAQKAQATEARITRQATNQGA
ncbi:hypothetical protein V502_04578 [Pseudogymnoascus sp. VKM F-4520 (FW-2644)]|nr:hypothetical protein V502_04578 [Pseudogymnoascus sp. VKM F-4520 (FW-2644)]